MDGFDAGTTGLDVISAGRVPVGGGDARALRLWRLRPAAPRGSRLASPDRSNCPFGQEETYVRRRGSTTALSTNFRCSPRNRPRNDDRCGRNGDNYRAAGASARTARGNAAMASYQPAVDVGSGGSVARRAEEDRRERTCRYVSEDRTRQRPDVVELPSSRSQARPSEGKAPRRTAESAPAGT